MRYGLNNRVKSPDDKAYNDRLRRICARLNAPNLHFIEGSSILTECACLSEDLVHPSDYGHLSMGEKLAERLRPIVQRYVAQRDQRKKGENMR